ncbi:DUF6049 family protein [Spirillospora sp. NPDC029432]|uniref:DUF6049 family protein n=1 Tax=Spirillospora sp. NPDC029432 TaxID=3154599 RepID=UPI003452F5CA
MRRRGYDRARDAGKRRPLSPGARRPPGGIPDGSPGGNGVDGQGVRTVLHAVAATTLLSCVVLGTAPTAMAVPAEPAAGAAAAADPARDRGGAAQDRSKTQVTLALGTVTPKTAEATGAKSKITVTGAVRNVSGQALPGVTVRLRTSAHRMSSRTELAQFAAGQPARLSGAPASRPLPQAGAAGGSASFSLSTTTAAIGLRQFGVYPIGVEVLNQYGQALAGVTTFVTFMPRGTQVKPLSVAWVWPLMSRQHRAADDTFLDDRLAAEISPQGRLGGLVGAAAGTRTPLTWSIDPALMDDVHTMASGAYTVKPPKTERGTRKEKSPAAETWLNALRTASKDDPYFTVPYADPDAVALVRHKMQNHLGIAYGNTGVAGQVLRRQPNAQVAWPPSGMAGPGTLDQMAKLGRLGNGPFLMSSAAFADPAQGYTPSATTSLPTSEGAKRAVVYDETLNKIVSADTRSPGAAVLAEQRFLAETAMISAEAPTLARSLVVVPDRRWNPSPAFAKNLLNHTGSSAWMRTTELAKVAAATPQERVYRGYPDSMEAYELGERYLREVARISRSAARFGSVMAEPITMNYRRAVLRAESSAWRGKSRYRQAVAARGSLDDRLDADMGRVTVIPPEKDRVSLAGDSGKFPITIVNGLPNQTIEVRLEVVSENTARLQVGEVDDEDKLITLGPGQKRSRWIPVQAAGNGDVRVQARLKSSDGRTFGEATYIKVRTTGYGQLALLITGGGLAVLFVGVGVRAIRARRRRKAEAAGDGSTGMGPAAAGPAGAAGSGAAAGAGPVAAGTPDFRPPTRAEAARPPAGPGPVGPAGTPGSAGTAGPVGAAGAAGPAGAPGSAWPGGVAAESAAPAGPAGPPESAPPAESADPADSADPSGSFGTAAADPWPAREAGPGAAPGPSADAESGAGTSGWPAAGRHRGGDQG